MSNVFTKRFSNFHMAEEPCEHILAGAPCFCEYVESDSFGTVGEAPVCKECYDIAEAESQSELHTCIDCKTIVPRSEGIFWRWYDFYAAQGDEAAFVCHECRKKPQHIRRVEKDQAAREEELGY